MNRGLVLRCSGWLAVGLLWLGSPARAHQDHAPGPIASAPSIQAPADELDMSLVTPEQIVKELPKPVSLQSLDWGEALSEHVHNKLVHFPLALGLAASLLWVLALRQPGHEPAARLLLVSAALIGAGAVLTGQAQEDVFRDSALAEIVEWHEKAGFVSLGLLLLGALWQWHGSWRRVIWPYAITLVLVLLTTGLIGGVVSHGHHDAVPAAAD